MPLLFARCTIERRHTSRLPPLPSPPAAHCSHGSPRLQGKGREGSFSANRQTQTERELTHLPSFHSLFISPLLSFASFTILTSPFGTLPLHSLRALQGGGGWWRREGDYDRHGMKVVRRKKEGSGRKIKLLLSELARSVCARRAIWGGRGEKAI